MCLTSRCRSPVVAFLVVSLLTAIQCRGQSDDPNLQIKQTDSSQQPDFVDKIVVGVASLKMTKSYTFKCERTDGASGDNLRWEYVPNPQKSLQQSLTSNGSTLTLENVQDDTLGLYRCRQDSSSMEDLLMTDADPAVIPVQSHVSLLENDPLHLAVYSSGVELMPQSHSWRLLNDDVIPNATMSESGRELTIPSVKFQNDSVYVCKVVVFDGFTPLEVIRNFTVTVYVPPVILDSPQSDTVDEFSNITFECRASGNPAPTITWNRNDGTFYPQETTLDSGLPVVRSIYTITGVRFSAGGEYRCTASIPSPYTGQPELTSTSQEASITVHPMLLLQHRIGNEELQLTGTVIYIIVNGPEVVISCIGSEVQVWVGPSGVVVSMSTVEEVYQMQNSSSGAQNLIISSFALNNSGNYTCRSSVPNLEKSILITMNNPAVFPVEPVVFAPQDTTATLSVTVSGSPVPTEENITWYYNENSLTSGARYSFGASNRELTVASVESGDYGQYICVVNTSAGVDRASIMLVEPSLPTVAIMPPSVTVLVGQEIRVNCTASGSGQLDISWTKEGTDGLPDSAVTTPGGMLRIESPSLSHGGNYTCVVRNIAGEREADLEVIVKAPPEVEIVPVNGNEIQNGHTVHISEGTSGTEFLCSATGYPIPVVSWEYSSSTENVRTEAVPDSNSLKLIWDGDVSTNHSGEYTCKAENDVATVTKGFTISVQPPTIGAEKVHVQLRILTDNCMEWSPEELSQARTSVSTTVYNSTLDACGCNFDSNQFTSPSFVCSYEVSGAVLFRITITSFDEDDVPASTIFAAFSSWARSSPTLVILGVEAQVDDFCNPLAELATSPECPTSVANPLPFDLWVLIVICVVGAAILVVVVVVLAVCCGYCCCFWKKGFYSTYARSMTRSNSFQGLPFPRASRSDVPVQQSYAMGNCGESERVYDEPAAVRQANTDEQTNGHVLMLGSSSDNSSNVEGVYSMLHADEEQDQAFSSLQQAVPPPQTFIHASLMSGVTSSSFVQVPLTIKSAGSGSQNDKGYAVAQEGNRKLSAQDGTPNVSSQSVNSGRGARRQLEGVWYHESADILLQDYSLSQPVYHTPKEPIAYMEPSPLRSQTAAVTGHHKHTPVRRTASQLQSGPPPQLPAGLRIAIV